MLASLSCSHEYKMFLHYQTRSFPRRRPAAMERDPCPTEPQQPESLPALALEHPLARLPAIVPKSKGGRPKKEKPDVMVPVPEPPRVVVPAASPDVAPAETPDSSDPSGDDGGVDSDPVPREPATETAPPVDPPSEVAPECKSPGVKAKAPKKRFPCVVKTKVVYYGGRKLKVDEVDEEDDEDDDEDDEDEYEDESSDESPPPPTKRLKKRVSILDNSVKPVRRITPTRLDDLEDGEWRQPQPSFYIL